MLNLTGIPIPLEILYPSTTKYMILSVSPLFEYKNGERLEKQIGTRYQIGCPLDCEKFSVKVLGKKALCSNEDLADLNEAVYAHLVNPIIKEYRLPDGKYGVTVTADDIILAND